MDDTVLRYYGGVPEEDRLATGPFQLECARTKEVVERHLPPPPATVLDIGGAAGAYSLWLADRGYDVHLLDLVPRLVSEAERRSREAMRPIATCRVGDARQLPFGDATAHAVLLLGPLYHLTETDDRLAALREAHRVLRPGGVLFAAAISRYASLLDGLSRDLFADPRFTGIVQQDLATGQHRNDTERPDYFTTAYFHRPDELDAEVRAAGFECQALIGLEGPGWILPDFDRRWADPRQQEDLLRAAQAVEQEPAMVGVSAHLLAVGNK